MSVIIVVAVGTATGVIIGLAVWSAARWIAVIVVMSWLRWRTARRAATRRRGYISLAYK